MSEKEKVTQDVSTEAKAKPAKENKPAKAKKDKKPGIGKRIGKYFRELKSELKKVAWPTKADTIKRTGTVIACAILVGIIVWIFDGLAGAIIDALLSLFGK